MKIKRARGKRTHAGPKAPINEIVTIESSYTLEPPATEEGQEGFTRQYTYISHKSVRKSCTVWWWYYMTYVVVKIRWVIWSLTSVRGRWFNICAITQVLYLVTSCLLRLTNKCWKRNVYLESNLSKLINLLCCVFRTAPSKPINTVMKMIIRALPFVTMKTTTDLLLQIKVSKTTQKCR